MSDKLREAATAIATELWGSADPTDWGAMPPLALHPGALVSTNDAINFAIRFHEEQTEARVAELKGAPLRILDEWYRDCVSERPDVNIYKPGMERAYQGLRAALQGDTDE